MPHTSSDKPWSPTVEQLPLCHWFRTSGKSQPIHLAKGISQEYRCRKRMLQKLIATLNAVGKPTELYETKDGTRLLILPYGGRILGVFAPGSEENFLWTNSTLDSVESARAFYASNDWQNSGGDRTWLAPELDFFFPAFPNIDIAGYWQPRALDPGNYEVTNTDHGIQLTNHLSIKGFWSNKTADLE